MSDNLEGPNSSPLSRRAFSVLLLVTGGVVSGLVNFVGSPSLLSRRQWWITDVLTIFSRRKYLSYIESLKMSGYQLFQHDLDGVETANTFKDDSHVVRRLGFSGSVWMNREGGRIVKVVSPHAVTSSGRLGRFSPGVFGYRDLSQAFTSFFNKEQEAYSRLQSFNSKYIPRDIKFDPSNNSISMEYLGEDFCVQNEQSKKILLTSEDEKNQIVAMFDEYRKIGIFKQNTFSSNLFKRTDGAIVATDFKMWTERSVEHLDHQVRMIYYNLGALDRELPRRIRDTFSDLPQEVVSKVFDKYERILGASDKIDV